MAIGTAFGFLILAAIELIVRRVIPDWKIHSGNNDIILLHEFSETRGWELKRDVKEIINGKSISINKQGFRGEDRTIHPDKTQIVVLGDSLSFGYGVGDDETFSHDLEERDGSLEVENLSVQGYGTDQELLELMSDGFSFHPNIVILTFCLFNDFYDNENSRFIYDHVHLKPYFTIADGTLVLHNSHLHFGPLRKALLWLNDESVLFNWLEKELIPGLQSFRQNIAGKSQPLAEGVYFEPTLSILRFMKDVIVENNALFVVLIVPYLDMPQNTKVTGTLINAKELAGAIVIDAGRYFAQAPSREELYIPDGVHLSPAGHRVVADAVYNELLPFLHKKH